MILSCSVAYEFDVPLASRVAKNTVWIKFFLWSNPVEGYI